MSTIAGTGLLGSSGDGSAATSATLSHPAAILVSTSGAVFLSSPTSIREITASALMTTFAGIIFDTGY